METSAGKETAAQNPVIAPIGGSPMARLKIFFEDNLGPLAQ